MPGGVSAALQSNTQVLVAAGGGEGDLSVLWYQRPWHVPEGPQCSAFPTHGDAAQPLADSATTPTGEGSIYKVVALRNKRSGKVFTWELGFIHHLRADWHSLCSQGVFTALQLWSLPSPQQTKPPFALELTSQAACKDQGLMGDGVCKSLQRTSRL